MGVFEGVVDEVIDDHTDFLGVAPCHYMFVRQEKFVADVSLLRMDTIFLTEYFQVFPLLQLCLQIIQLFPYFAPEQLRP